MRESAQPLILFGGTFDPIHRAHVRAALAVSAVLGDAPVRLLPNAVPPHRAQPRASAGDRLAMVARACAGHRLLAVDDWELRQPGPSYTVTTLKHFRRQIGPKRPLVFMVGADSLAGLDLWEGWRRFTALCHLAVVPRPGAPQVASAVARAFPRGRPAQLLCRPAGRRLMLRHPYLDVSATEVRATLAEYGDCRALDPKVLAHIRHRGLYTVPATHPNDEAS
jgi:nicotinate-nucleotide adenylyltransferase